MSVVKAICSGILECSLGVTYLLECSLGVAYLLECPLVVAYLLIFQMKLSLVMFVTFKGFIRKLCFRLHLIIVTTKFEFEARRHSRTNPVRSSNLNNPV